jgi:hypothetical protein
MERWLEEDKRERQRYRQRKKNGTLTESEKRIAAFLARGRREMEELNRSQAPADPPE